MSSVYNWGKPKPDQADFEKLQALLNFADASLKEATNFAREKGLSFHYDGPAYGMGGEFDPFWDTDEDQEDDEPRCGWQASSQSC